MTFWIVLSRFADILGVLGFAISGVTLIVALNFRTKLMHHDEKRSFIQHKKVILNKLNGFLKSVTQNDLYDEQFLQHIDLDIGRLIIDYNFFGKKLKATLNETSILITTVCLAEARDKTDQHKHDLSKKLSEIISLIERESTII